jgi:hypothetical protein
MTSVGHGTRIGLKLLVADNSADFVPVAGQSIPVIAGLDPAIHLLRETRMKFGGCPDQVRAGRVSDMDPHWSQAAGGG